MSPTVQFEGDRSNIPSANVSLEVVSSSLKAPERNQPISVDFVSQLDKSSAPNAVKPSQVPDFSSESDGDENDRTFREHTNQSRRPQRSARSSLRRSRSQLSLESSPSDSEVPQIEETKFVTSQKVNGDPSGELSAKKHATPSVNKRPRLNSGVSTPSGTDLNGGPEMRSPHIDTNVIHAEPTHQNYTPQPSLEFEEVTQVTLPVRNGASLASDALPLNSHAMESNNASLSAVPFDSSEGGGLDNHNIQISGLVETSSLDPKKNVAFEDQDNGDGAEVSPLTDKVLVNIMPFPEGDASGWDRFIFFSHRPQRFDFKEKTYLSNLSPFSAVTSCMDNVSISNVCAVCGAGGRLRNCHRCKLAFHGSCLAMPTENHEFDSWMCAACRSARTNDGNKGPPILPSPDTGLRRLTIDVQEGNPIDSVLNPSLFNFYKADVGADWLKCRKCGRIRLVEDGVLSESVHIPFVCSQAFWLPATDRKCSGNAGDVSMLGEEEQRVSERLKNRSRMRNALFFYHLDEVNREDYGFPPLPNAPEEDDGVRSVSLAPTQTNRENSDGTKSITGSQTGLQTFGIHNGNGTAVNDKASNHHKTGEGNLRKSNILPENGQGIDGSVEVVHCGKRSSHESRPNDSSSNPARRPPSSPNNVLPSSTNADSLRETIKNSKFETSLTDRTRALNKSHAERVNGNCVQRDNQRSIVNGESQSMPTSSGHATGETAGSIDKKIPEVRERDNDCKVDSVDPVQIELLQVIGNLGFEQSVEDGLADMALRDDKMLLSLFVAYGRSPEGLEKFRRHAGRLARKLGLGNGASVASSASVVHTAPATQTTSHPPGPIEPSPTFVPQPATVLGTSLTPPPASEQVSPVNMSSNPHTMFVAQGARTNPRTTPFHQAPPGSINSLGVAPSRPRGPTTVGARHTLGYGTNPPPDQGFISSNISGVGVNPVSAISVSGTNRIIALAVEFKEFRVRQLSQASEFYMRAKSQMEAAELNSVHEVHRATIRDAKYLHNKQQEQLKQFVTWYQSRYQLHSQTNQQHYQSQHRQHTSHNPPQPPPMAQHQQSHMQPTYVAPDQNQAHSRREAILRQQLQQSLQHPSQSFQQL